MCQCVKTFLTVFGGFKHPAKPAMTWGSIGGLKPGPWNLFCMKNYPHELGLDLAADSGSDGFLMNWWEFLDVFMDVHVKCWNSPRRILRNHGTLVQCRTCCDRCHACAVWCSCRNSHFFTNLRGLWGWIVVPVMEMLWFIAPRNYLPYLVGGIPTPPKKWWSSSVGMTTFPIYGKS